MASIRTFASGKRLYHINSLQQQIGLVRRHETEKILCLLESAHRTKQKIRSDRLKAAAYSKWSKTLGHSRRIAGQQLRRRLTLSCLLVVGVSAI